MYRWLVPKVQGHKRKRRDSTESTDEIKSVSPFQSPITTPISTQRNRATGLTPMVGNINFTPTTTSTNTNNNNNNNNNNKQSSKDNNNNNKKKTNNNQ